MKLTISDICRGMQPGVDDSGVLFFHGERVYRAFRGDAARLHEEILSRGYLEELVQAGLVRYQRAEITVDGFDLVVEAQRVPVITYPMEWPTRMVKEAALAMARVGRVLGRRGLVLKDGHPWNVLFKGTSPVFVDLGSIVRGQAVPEHWWCEFRRYLALPLALRTLGWHDAADKVLATHNPRESARMLWNSGLLRRVFPLRYGMLRRHLSRPDAFFAQLIDVLEDFDGTGRSMEWSTYQTMDTSVGDPAKFDAKQSAAHQFLGRLEPGSILDMAANAGWYSRLAHSMGFSPVAIDIDDKALGLLYESARRDCLPILPVKMDVLWPTANHGMGLAHSDAIARLRSDHVMVIALLHHLCRNQGVRFEFFAHLMNQYARKAAIVEFIPREDVHVSRWPLAREGWYTEEHLVAAMRPYFSRVTVLPSCPEPRRMLLFER